MADPQNSQASDTVSSSVAPRLSTRQGLRSPGLPRVAVGLVFVLLLQVVGGILLTPQGALLAVGPISIFALPILGTLADFAIPQLSNRYNS